VTAPQPVTRIGAYVICLDAAGRILLCRIRDGTPVDGHWTLPGDGLEFGESPESGALRELAEETGLEGDLVEVAGTHSLHRASSRSVGGRPLHWVGIIYRARITGGSLRGELDGSTDTCSWFAESEARGLPLVELGLRGIDLAFGGPA
jgi:ADP-ribose pyrophosphatase YjhB (NUDIX family)